MRNDPKPVPLTCRGSLFRACHALPAEETTAVIVRGFIACDLKPFNLLIDVLPKLIYQPAGSTGT